jgi:hypothetical protein
MPHRIIVDRTNLIGNDNNNFIYRFPSSVAFPNHEIALSSIDLYYSWYNVSAEMGNNTFSYVWVDGITYTVVIEDGLYEISTINERLQFEFIANGHYLVDSGGNNIYYINISANTTRYATQIDIFLFPNALPAGYTNPASVVFPPTNQITMNIPSNFNELIGFTANTTIGNLASISNLSFLSTIAPNIQPNNVLYVSISNIDNQYGSPSGLVHRIVPNTTFGSLISEVPEFSFSPLHSGTYNQLQIQILGTDKRPIKIIDPNIVISFLIKNKEQAIYA